MANYKFIACDLDGTLLRNDMSVSAENLAAIEKLSELDVIFTPTTGRALNEIPEPILNNDKVRYIAYSNGAVILDKKTGEKIYECLPHDTSVKIFDLLRSYDTAFMVHYDGYSYVDAVGNDSVRYKNEYHMTDNFCELIADINIPVENFDDFCHNMDEIEMICCFFRHDYECAEVIERIKNEFPDVGITSSCPGNIEVFHKNASKGHAIKRLTESLSININDVVAIGDSPNDTVLLETVGIGLAVENAVDSLKEVADEVICTNEEHVLPYVIENYLLNEFADEIIDTPDEKEVITDTPDVNTKSKKKAKIFGIIAASAIVLAMILVIIFGGESSVVKVGYVGNSTWSSWTGNYNYLDGEMKHTIISNSDSSILHIAVTTEEGSISIQITDSEGNIIFDENNIETRTFELPVDGKVRIKIEAEKHKGGFVIGH